jgi:hypothetical protein
MTTSVDRSTAIHEAGHGVVSLAFGDVVEWIAVGAHAKDGSQGRLSGFADLRHVGRSRLAALASTLAGKLAMTEFGFADQWSDDGFAEDRRLVQQMDPDDRELKTAELLAAATVRNHRSAIERVADALEGRGLLTGGEVRELARIPGKEAQRAAPPIVKLKEQYYSTGRIAGSEDVHYYRAGGGYVTCEPDHELPQFEGPERIHWPVLRIANQALLDLIDQELAEGEANDVAELVAACSLVFAWATREAQEYGYGDQGGYPALTGGTQ